MRLDQALISGVDLNISQIRPTTTVRGPRGANLLCMENTGDAGQWKDCRAKCTDGFRQFDCDSFEPSGLLPYFAAPAILYTTEPWLLYCHLPWVPWNSPVWAGP